ncbi:hypothetical protein TPAR_04052 [Tolypocladium paradoxum]|uniref:FAD-dependent oxidoreductase 2 FAD-binding domain-containing protein n=1 Tax=Tolypocladium paradoxum TaxID=94208 RepID=A0A2S4KZV6_9HYPO|nr:hypothetical protein TPAR_04052 [Tolypocladium paradoxum]
MARALALRSSRSYEPWAAATHQANSPGASKHRRRAFSSRPNSTESTRDGAVHEETDVLIIGSGAGALTAALRSKARRLRVIVVEKERTLGGASAISGGGLWIPCNPVSKAAGVVDSKSDALKYFEQAVGNVGPASSPARREAFLDNGPRMIEFLQQLGLQLCFSKGYPDYYPKMDGAMGKGGGRSIESKPFDLRRLGAWQSALPSTRAPAAIQTVDAPIFTRPTSSPGAFAYTIRKMIPLKTKAFLGHKLASMGLALVAQLTYFNIKHSVDIRLETSLAELIQDSDGKVVGAKLNMKTGCRNIYASRRLILAAGGYAHNKHMRERFMMSPASTDWTSSPKGDTGDAIVAGMKLDAATALLDDAWWGPTILDPVTSKPSFAVIERARPHCIIVDASGCRFMNEAQSYTDAGHDQYARNNNVKAIPAWMILDTNHRNRYVLGHSLSPRMKPEKALAEGKMFAADTVEELARQIGVDAEGLTNTIRNYNKMCETGVDAEFGKGDNAYDNFLGDPTASCRNPNMGPLNKAPFYAIQVWPGDLGTKGGLLTDEFQRVVHKDGGIIPGLFAIGNTAASIMGRTYLGAGSTLGPAMTHGFVAANYLADNY